MRSKLLIITSNASPLNLKVLPIVKPLRFNTEIRLVLSISSSLSLFFCHFMDLLMPSKSDK